jgi:hypothetical protein
MTRVEEEHDFRKCGVCYDDFDNKDWTTTNLPGVSVFFYFEKIIIP